MGSPINRGGRKNAVTASNATAIRDGYTSHNATIITIDPANVALVTTDAEPPIKKRFA